MENTDKDGGARSRKLWFAAGTSFLIVGASLFVPAVAFAEVVTGLISVCAIYVGGNTAAKWVMNRNKKTKSKPPGEVPPIKKPPTKPPLEQG